MYQKVPPEHRQSPQKQRGSLVSMPSHIRQHNEIFARSPHVGLAKCHPSGTWHGSQAGAAMGQGATGVALRPLAEAGRLLAHACDMMNRATGTSNGDLEPHNKIALPNPTWGRGPAFACRAGWSYYCGVERRKNSRWMGGSRASKLHAHWRTLPVTAC